MTHLVLEGRLGRRVEIDLCATCRTIWFDRFESLQLTPSATLKVFQTISQSSGARTTTFPSRLQCPRCASPLVLTHDLQRSTPFQYWRCDAGHGHLIAFIDFLREKDFIRPLTPQQLDELRRNLQTINCSNCGAAIDLAKDSACAHCGSALSMLDVSHMARTLGQFQTAASGSQADERTRSVPVPLVPTDIDALVRALKAGESSHAGQGLIETGLGLLTQVLKNLIP